MGQIHVLDKQTVDQIAAGEVVERPSSVVKELVENAMDAGAGSVTVEIRNGGIGLIRVTDNGSGIAKEDVPIAFLQHATSKIRDASDLAAIRSLGFRGEALSSIAAVSRLELITKVPGELTAADYVIHGGSEVSMGEIGAPDGTTFLVEDLFYNTPARRKFLKTPMTEASYIGELLEHMAFSRPDVSIRFINNGNVRLSTPGNGRVKDLIYAVYGRETANLLLPVEDEKEGIKVTGFIGKPELAKGSRAFESFFINGRFVRSALISKAIEEAYAPYLMQHRFPFTMLYLTIPPEEFDVNVHPQKLELRFQKESVVYDTIVKILSAVLRGKELIPEISLGTEKKAQEEKPVYKAPEPFEEKRTELLREKAGLGAAPKAPEEKDTPKQPENKDAPKQPEEKDTPVLRRGNRVREDEKVPEEKKSAEKAPVFREPAAYTVKQEEVPAGKPVQQELFDERFLSEEGLKKCRVIGQLFRTYWLMEAGDRFYMMDQHAAHEKVLYERKMKELQERKMTSQLISPPVVVTLSASEDLVLNRYMDAFAALGYEISSFGGSEYAISAVPADLYGIDVQDFLREVLSDMGTEFGERNHEMILHKVATASCKAAVKGSQLLTEKEAEALLTELLTLENPYMCPHGRPTLISMTRSEIEKRFKRIV